MRLNFMHFISILIFFLASLVLFGQHVPINRTIFKVVKEGNISQSVLHWHMFENQDIAESTSHLVVQENEAWQYERLPNDHLKTVFSQNGRFVASVTLNPRNSIDPIDRELKITVFDSDNNILYTLRRMHLYDRSLPELVLSDKDGSLILGENDAGKLWFYDTKGSVINQVNLFAEASYDLERILIMELSADGSRIAVLASKRGSAPAGSGAINPDADPHLILFDSRGEETWRKELPENAASEMDLSPDGSKILVNNYTTNQGGDITRKSLIFNAGGEMIFETDLLYKYAQFSRNSRQVILADNQMIQLIDLENKMLFWQKKISRKEGIISQVATVENADLSVVLIGKNDWNREYFVYRDPKIWILDEQGMLLQEIKFKDQTFRTPALWISEDGDRFKVGFENTFYTYSAK